MNMTIMVGKSGLTDIHLQPKEEDLVNQLSEENRKKLIEILQSAPDCGDNSCRYRFKHPSILSGMRTNGGCRCNSNEPLQVKHFGWRMKTFLDELFDKNSRIVTVHIYLRPNDIADFRFNDIVYLELGIYALLLSYRYLS